MRHISRILVAGALAASLSGCLARAAVDVVTLPVRAVGSGVDAVTTSQSEADEKRGREIRRREENLGKLERSYRKHNDRCSRGDDEACDRARADYDAMQGAASGDRYRD